MTSCKRTFIFFLLICLGCAGQLSSSDLSQRIERQLRVSYSVPATVKVMISSPRASEFPNYDAVTVTFDDSGKKKDYDFLVSKDQKTLLRMTKMDLSKDPYADVMSKIDVRGRPIRGNPNAKVVVVNFDDFECPFCARVHQTLFPELLKEYGDRVAFIYKDFPLSDIHPWAIHAAIDANCLAAQSTDAYWDFADYIHGNQQVVNQEKDHDGQFAALDRITLSESDKFRLDRGKLQSCVKDQIATAVTASVKEGESLGISGTPATFVNGQLVDGARPLSEYRSVFDSALQQAGVPVNAHTPAATANAPQPPASTIGGTVQR